MSLLSDVWKWCNWRQNVAAKAKSNLNPSYLLYYLFHIYRCFILLIIILQNNYLTTIEKRHFCIIIFAKYSVKKKLLYILFISLKIIKLHIILFIMQQNINWNKWILISVFLISVVIFIYIIVSKLQKLFIIYIFAYNFVYTYIYRYIKHTMIILRETKDVYWIKII